MNYEEENFIDNGRKGPTPVQGQYRQEKDMARERIKLQEYSEGADESGASSSGDLNAPRDRLNLIYLIFLIHGIGNLMPWNMFITASTYFTEYKLSYNYTQEHSPYVSQFMQYLTFSAQVPCVVFNWANIFLQMGGTLSKRIIVSIIILIIVFVVTIILAMVDSSSWPSTFFWLTMISVVVLNMSNGIYQNTIFGLAAKLPGKYTGAVILGTNISGTIVTLIAILTTFVTSNQKMAAIYFFIGAIFVLLICFDTYFALPLNRFYRHHELKEKKENEARKRVNRGTVDSTPFWYIIKKASPQLFNVFFVFFVTISVFPAIHANVQRVDEDFFLAGNYYTQVTCFLTFNLFAMFGSGLTSWFQWPAPKHLWILVVARVVYIPFFLLCNYQVPNVERHLPVLVQNDWLYWIAAMSLGLTSGYFSSLAMIYAPGTVDERYASNAGMFAGAFLITGIFFGILSTFLWPIVITLSH